MKRRKKIQFDVDISKDFEFWIFQKRKNRKPITSDGPSLTAY